MSGLFERAKKNLESAEFEKAGKKRFLGRSYEKHFENYEEEVYIKKNGKKGVRRVYKGMYYQQDLSRSSYILLRITYVLCLSLSVMLFGTGASLKQGSNFVLWITLAQSVTGLLLLWMLIVLILYLFTPKKMTKSDYSSGSRALSRAAGNTVIGMAAVTVLTAIYDFLHFRELERDDFICILCFGVSIIFVLVIYILEKRVTYLTFFEADETINKIPETAPKKRKD